MATEKQIAANRANAKRSTGPKTEAGKQRSSQNAHRHGLSQPGSADASAIALVDVIAQALVPEAATEDQSAAARAVASAQVELVRIQKIRAEQWAAIEQNVISSVEFKGLKNVSALDRYTRYAETKRRRASKKLG